MSKLYSRGSSGPDVSEIQAALNFHIREPAKPLSPDGIFGQLTAERVREFQFKAGLIVDGIVGPNTLSALYARAIGTSEVYLTPKQPEALSTPPRRPLLPASGFPIGRLPFGPLPLPPPMPPQLPNSKKTQVKYPVSTGFDVKSQVVIDPFADDKEKPVLQYKFTLGHEIPWPVLLPPPATLSFDFSSTPYTSKYSISGKLKVPFYVLKLPTAPMYKSGSLKPYFYTGMGVTNEGFGKLKTGVGAALKVKVIELPYQPYLPTISFSADGGYEYKLDLYKRKMEGDKFLKLTVGMEWHFGK